MDKSEVTAIEVIFGVATIGWLAYALDAYMQLSLYGSILALFAGYTFLFLAKKSAPKKELAALFGWNDDLFFHSFFRMPLYASIFLGPIIKHSAQYIAPDYFSGAEVWLPIVAISWIVGFCVSLLVKPLSERKTS